MLQDMHNIQKVGGGRRGRREREGLESVGVDLQDLGRSMSHEGKVTQDASYTGCTPGWPAIHQLPLPLLDWPASKYDHELTGGARGVCRGGAMCFAEGQAPIHDLRGVVLSIRLPIESAWHNINAGPANEKENCRKLLTESFSTRSCPAFSL